MRWTSENDQLLLITLLDTHNINVKGDLISKAWPQDGRDVPTGRAITERIVKIRAMAKTTMEASPVKTPTEDSSSPSATPSKRKKSTPKSKVRKPAQEGDDVEEESSPSPSKKQKKAPTPKKKPAAAEAVNKNNDEEEEVSARLKQAKVEDDSDEKKDAIKPRTTTKKGTDAAVANTKKERAKMVKRLAGVGSETDDTDIY